MISQHATPAPEVPHDALQFAEPTADPLLPVVDRQHLPALNAFYRRRGVIETTLAGRGATIATTWPFCAELPSDMYAIELRADDIDGELFVPLSVLDTLGRIADSALSIDRLEPEIAAVVVEFALAEALAAVEMRVGCHLSFLSAGPRLLGSAQEGRLSLAFRLELDGAGISTCVLALASGDALRLARHLDRGAGIESNSLDPPVVVALRIAATTLTVSELERLMPDDVVLLDAECRPDGTAIAVIAEHFVAPVELTPAGSLLTARPARGRGSPWEWSMDKPMEDFGAAALEDSELDELPVRLIFELGRIELPLGEIRRLAPGALVPLSHPLDEPLDIVANGKRLGRGTLVKIGQSFGIRIVSLVGND